MCGIFGVVYFDGSKRPSEENLRRSADLISHRGQDGSGIYSDEGIGLAHTRLSLVDLSERSNQPFWDPTGRYCVVYNGEIYNFRELKLELEDQGISFQTTSDTEVLLQSLIQNGPSATLPRLEGMFAFAFYDRLERKLLLARDRFGIKPLMVYRDGEKLLFASEVKSMQPWIELRPNALRMVSFLMHFGEPANHNSLFENIEFVAPGSMIHISFGSEPVTEAFSDLMDLPDPDLSERLEGLTPEQAVDHIDELLQTSVSRMLLADAPVGALCSGGVDSSLIMAMAAKQHSNLAIFHADVVGPLSEYQAASQLAKHLKLDLLTIKVRDSDFIASLPVVLQHYEQPFFRHQHSVPFMMVCKLVQENGVKGVLTGEGSDEGFLGYNYLAQEPVWNFYKRQVKRLEMLLRLIPKVGSRLWSTHGQTCVLVGDMLAQFEETAEQDRFRKGYADRMGKAHERNVRSLDLLSYHLRTLLHRNDTMGMAASIEARFPFLDENLVKTAVNLPYRYKNRFSPTVWEKAHPFMRDKWVIRRVADRYLPKVLSQRQKWGFPVSAFDRMQIKPEFFANSFVVNNFKLSDEKFSYLFEGEGQGLKIRLLMLDIWGQMFIQGETRDRIQERLSQYVITH